MTEPVPTRREAIGEWQSATAPAPALVDHEIAAARLAAVQAPLGFFNPRFKFRAVQALSTNTRRAYRADWAAFIECCSLHNRDALPAPSQALETFIEWRSPEQEHLAAQGMYKYVTPGSPRQPIAAASLARALAAIAKVHAWLGYYDPTAIQSVRDTLKINTEGRLAQAQKDPLLWKDIARAFESMDSADLWTLRDKALVAVGHCTMFRRSNLVAVTFEDFQRIPDSETARIAVRKTKTDSGKYTTYRTVPADVAAYLQAWIVAAKISSGPLFRGITPDRRVKETGLNAGEVARIFKRVARAAGLPNVAKIGGHSTRIGATHDMNAFGCDVLDIMQDGGWKSPMMPKRYLENKACDDGGMARMGRARVAKTAAGAS